MAETAPGRQSWHRAQFAMCRPLSRGHFLLSSLHCFVIFMERFMSTNMKLDGLFLPTPVGSMFLHFFSKHFLVDRPTFDGTWNNFFRTAGTLFVHGFGIVPKRKKLTGAKDRLKIPWNVSWPRMRPFCGTGEYTKRPLNE